MTAVTMEIWSRSPSSNLGLLLALMLLCTKFGENTSNIALDIEQKPFLNDLHDLENKVKVMRFKLGSLPCPGAPVHQNW